MAQKEHDLFFIIMNCLLTILGIEAVFPRLNTIYNYNVICLVCLFGWVLISIFADKHYYLSQDIRNLYPLIFCLVTALIPYLYGIGVIGNRYLSLGLIPFGYFIFNYYKDKDRLSDLKKICVITALFATVTFIKTLIALIADPFISRSIKSTGEHLDNLSRQGIGGYAFIYFIVIASVFLLYIAVKSESAFIKFISFIGYISSLFFVLKSNYMTALLTTVLASLIFIISHLAEGGAGKSVVLLVVMIIIIVGFFNMDAIISRFSDFIPKRIASVMIAENGNSIFQSIIDEFLNDRWPTMLTGLENFIKHPFFGVISSDEITTNQSGFLEGFGQHSYILDTFTLYGFVIGIINIMIILKPFKDQYGNRVKYGRTLNNAMLVCIIGIYLFNNATLSTALAFGIIFPLLREIYDSGAEI